MAYCQLCESRRAEVIDRETLSVEDWIAKSPDAHRKVLALLAIRPRQVRQRLIRCGDCKRQYPELLLSGSPTSKAYLRANSKTRS